MVCMPPRARPASPKSPARADVAPPIESFAPLLRFRAIFASKEPLYHRVNPRAGELCDPYSYAPKLEEFLRALYETEFVVKGFDWSTWASGAGARHLRKAGALDRVGLLTLRRIATAHVRQERFCGGHLAGVVGRGDFARLLDRLAVLMGRGSEPARPRPTSRTLPAPTKRASRR
jgi:hypothetical protein